MAEGGRISARDGLALKLPRPGTPHLNGICPYYTMFPLTFPLRLLRPAYKASIVLDPFCGRGTTNLAARLLGLPSMGVDASPVAAAITQAKVSTARPKDVIRECRKILSESPRAPVPKGRFWDLCYHPDTLDEICRVRSSLLVRCNSSARKSLRGLVLGLLHGSLRRGPAAYLSNQMPRTYSTKPEGAVRFWSSKRLQPPRVNLLELVSRRAPLYLGHDYPPVRSKVAVSDARRAIPEWGGRQYTHVVTSPPYIGMDHYLRDQWLRNWFVGGPDKPEWDTRNAITTESIDRFIAELASVWTNVGLVSKRGAKLAVRFGCIPSMEVDPAAVIRASLDASAVSWKIQTICAAGTAGRGYRQSPQFLGSVKAPCEEVDIHAVLGNN